MATQVQFRRGTTSQNNAFTGAAGELTIDTDVWTLRIHDGTTQGGRSVPTLTATQTFTNKTFGSNNTWNGNAIGLSYGGTGASITAVAGAIAYSTGSALALSLAGTSGQVLTSGGTSGPTWVNASALSTGTATTATTATNIAGGSAGYLVYQQDTDTTGFIAPGTSGYVLRSTGASTPPAWVTSALTIGSTALQVGDTATSFDGLNILTATGTSHWKIPTGTTLQRPASPSAGMIRYNSTQSTFEGYSSGAWSSLGGVKSVDAYTYIQAETSAGASNGDLDFYAENSSGDGATQVGQWNRTNLKDYTGTLVGTQTTQNVFNTTATTVNAFGAATALTIGAATGTATIRNATVAITNAATVGSTLAVTGNTTLTGSLTANGGISCDSGVFTVADTSGNVHTSGTLDVDGAANFDSTVAITGATTITGDLAVNGGDITTTATGTATVFNTNATTLNIGGAATTVSIGAATGTATINNANVVITGNLTVNGTTTTINSTTTTVDDITFELGSVDTPTDITANGGGIVLKGATDKSITWGSTNGWTSTEEINIATGKTYKINGTSVLSESTLGSGVTTSSLTSVGTITSGTWSGSFGAVSGANLTNLTAGNLSGTIPSTVLGNSTHYIGTTAVALNRSSANLALTGISSITLPGSSSGTAQIIPSAVAGTSTVITLPASSGIVALTGYPNSTTSLPTGDLGSGEDYAGASSISDAFGVATAGAYTLMEPIGSIVTLDLNA